MHRRKRETHIHTHVHTLWIPGAGNMSADDVVFTGWLVKSPPEKKLNTRYSWRKRWFVLRQGRMSGNPDVLEYYRNKCSRKPIRTIDLQECEVHVHCGETQHQRQQTPQPLQKRPFQNQHLFVVKTAARVFYLLAKTQEEMNSWVQNINQICTFGTPDDTDSADSLTHTPTSQQPSPVLSPRISPGTSTDIPPSSSAAGRDRDSHPPPDYLILSQCKSGTVSIRQRCDSFTNSEHSLEQSSSETGGEDVFPSPNTSLSNTGVMTSSESLFLIGHAPNPPFSAPCSAPVPPPLCPSSSSSPRSLQHLAEVFCFDPPFCPTLDTPHTTHTPPPLPPKPTHLTDALGNPIAPPTFNRHRISMPSLDHLKRGESDSLARRRNKIASLHLSSVGSATVLCESDDSYVPMASPPVTIDMPSDGYMPMSPGAFPRTNGKPEAPPPRGADLEPPPVNRDLKPRRRARPPPLDLRGLSTIREQPTHLPLVRTHTEPSPLQHHVASERRWRPLTPVDPEALSTPTDRQLFFPMAESALQQPWWRSSRLDYLSLDFNAASPSPVLKKPLLADEHRVDYVQVDEKKTQALQYTKLEWKDVRQSKA